MRSLFRPAATKVFNKKTIVLINSNLSFLRNHFHHSTWSPNLKSNKAPQSIRNAALKKYGLSHLDLIWPDNTDPIKKVDYIEKNPISISQMYGESDLSKLPIFQGGFINFGYWPIDSKKEITIEERIASSKEMYKVIGDLANILENYNLLEVGSGLGYGSSLIAQHYKPKLVIGIDISPEQIARAKKYQMSGIKSNKLRFTIGEAESMPFVNSSFDCVISIEAAQHFLSIKDFSAEVSRVLKPGGKLTMASFFPTSLEGINALNAIIPNYRIHGSQKTIGEISKELANYMDHVKVSSIGKNVWYGFSKWLDQIGYHNQWSKIWSALYEKGLIDYVIYQAEAPEKDLMHYNVLN